VCFWRVCHLTCHTSTVTQRKQQEAEWSDMTQIKGRDQYEYNSVCLNVILSVSWRNWVSDVGWINVVQGRNTTGNGDLEYLHQQLALRVSRCVTGLLSFDVSKALRTFEKSGSTNSATTTPSLQHHRCENLQCCTYWGLKNNSGPWSQSWRDVTTDRATCWHVAYIDTTSDNKQ
jgi:hypothetical protein